MRLAITLAICACSRGATGPFFETPMFFNRDVSTAVVSRTSASQIATIDNAGGWGDGDRLGIDFSMDVLDADASTPRMMFEPTSDWTSPDCDLDAVPLPAGGNVEGETGYACTQGGDCHLLVYDRQEGELFEMWRADLTTTFRGGCLAVWHTHASYGDTLRGDQCTSADAAGLPIAPLLFTADEVAAGSIDHAIRFVLPNDRVQPGYVRPATHGSNETTAGPTAPYFGVHLRLRADYPIDTLPSAGAKVVARALQTYGMYHADGGEIALTAASDRRTVATWDGLLGAHDLDALAVDDFEVIDHGPEIALTFDCVR
jgi:serine/threonine-protein kinase